MPALAADNLGLILRAAINELDWFHYNMARAETPSMEQEEQFYLLQLGVTRLIRLSLEARSSFDVPTVLFRRDRSITTPVLKIAAGLGMIEHGRRIAQTTATGLCHIELAGRNEFLFTLPASIPDDDYYERVVSDHYRNESQRRFAELMNSEFGQKLGRNVEEVLTELVYPFHEHFIGYDADPLLDGYFFGIASHEIQLFDGYDTFHYATKFAGIPFQKYVLALTYVLSLFARHERFAEALIKKVPTIKLENVLTISSETSGFVESIKDALDYFGSAYEGYEETTLEEARKIFEVLSVSRRSTNLLARAGSPLPLMIQCSDHDHIRCQAAAGSSSMQFLLDSLRFHFPGDYDRHQRSRERSMQLAIKRVLNDGFPGLTYLENIKIRLGGRVLTDIDLVAMEEATGTVFLCQLKHQELYGANLHSRQVRTTRLRDDTSRWLSSVANWIETVGETGIRQSLQLPRKFPPLSVYRLVISRHYAYPLKDLAQGDDTTYANWNQFFNAIELAKQQMPQDRKLADFMTLLKKYEAPGGTQEHLPEPDTEWIIRDLKFTIRQEQSPIEPKQP